MTSDLKQHFAKHGYVVVPNLIPPTLLPDLMAASQRAVAKTRSGGWPHRRVVGRQFPPFDHDNGDSWGVQHLMHPDLGEPAFARWYTSDALLDAVRELLGCTEDELQMELFNLLINPLDHEFALRWHRDDVRENATEDDERTALGIWNHGVQWNTALHEDSCLYVVPGSHNQPRTPEQRSRSSTLEPPKNPLDMPGVLQVTIQPGETVFYNSNILHCATYDPHRTRATLHACIGDTRGGVSRARNVLQHGLEWMCDERFRETLDERGKGMLDNLIRLREGVHDEVGYSLI